MFALYGTIPAAPVLGCDEDHAQLDQIPIPKGLCSVENGDLNGQPWREMRFPCEDEDELKNHLILN